MPTILQAPSDWPHILLPAERAADATDLDAAARAGAYAGLRAALRDMGPTATIATVAASGLRGRGGAGFPTATKWRACAAVQAPRRYVIANAYGADAAAATDRTLILENPYAVLEGLTIAAFAVGATEAIVAIRADATDAIRALEAAIGEAEEAGYLGTDILGFGFDLQVEIRTLRGSAMLGEETVLIRGLEGKRAQPEQRPPYPTERGLHGMPTVVQNVQTLASVPWILAHGPEAFAATGVPGSPGTALVQLSGSLATPGIVEAPMGTTLRELVALGGGVPAGHRLKAILVGGSSGGFLPPDSLDLPYDFGTLRDAGAHLGSGSLLVADERACLVDLAKLLTRVCADNACGKTIPCRIGTRRLAEIAERMTDGRPRPTDLDLAASLSSDIVGSALCDHERLSTLPLASGLRYFRPEFDDHLLRSTCPAGVCHPIAVAAAGAAS